MQDLNLPIYGQKVIHTVLLSVAILYG